MNRFRRFTVFSALSISLAAVPMLAHAQDDHRDNHDDQAYNNNGADHHDAYVHHDEWKRGYQMRHDDWDRAQRVDDWRAHQLRRPPRGYEWRSIDGNYVLGAVDTGRINAVVTIH